MALVVHRKRYVYDHHRVKGKKNVVSTYIGTTAQIEVKKTISSKGYPVSSPEYPEAHKKADIEEKKEYGKERWDKVESIAEDIPKGELAGTHNDTIAVSKRVPEDYRGQVLYHEKKEKELMKGTGAKTSTQQQKQIKEALSHPDVPGAGAKKRAGIKSGDTKFKIVMAEYSKGTLRSSSGEKVTDIKQAQAIAFSEAHKVEPKYGKK